MSKEETSFINEKIVQKRQLKNIVLTIFLTALIVGVPTFLVSKTVFASLAGATTEAIWEPGTQVSESSYVIWKEDSTYYAKNGTTGQVEYSGTNATQVITNAIRANSKLYLKAGTYTITSTIRKSVHNVVIAGEGRGTIIKVQDSTQINAVNLTNVRNWIIRDLSIDGNKDNQVNAGKFDLQIGIFLGQSGAWHAIFAHAQNITLQNLWIYNIPQTGILGRSEGISRVTLQNCRVWNCDYGGISLRAINGSCLITDNYVWNIGIGGDSHHGIYIGSHGRRNGSVIITNNMVENIHDGDGIIVYCTRGTNSTVANNIVRNIGRIGIYVTSSLGYDSHTVVDGNQIFHPGLNSSDTWQYGIKVSGSYTVCSSNLVYDAPSVGIYVTAGKCSAVVGNIVKNGTATFGINIHESPYTTVAGNTVIGIASGGGIGILTGSNYSTVTGNTCSFNDKGIVIDSAYNNVISGNSASYNLHYGIAEWTASDYNNIVGCSCFGNPTMGIYILGSNTEVHSCFNGTTYIT